MGRLIDADNLLKQYKLYKCNIEELIEQAPTVLDIKELTEKAEKIHRNAGIGTFCSDFYEGEETAYEKIIDLIKART